MKKIGNCAVCVTKRWSRFPLSPQRNKFEEKSLVSGWGLFYAPESQKSVEEEQRGLAACVCVRIIWGILIQTQHPGQCSQQSLVGSSEGVKPAYSWHTGWWHRLVMWMWTDPSCSCSIFTFREGTERCSYHNISTIHQTPGAPTGSVMATCCNLATCFYTYLLHLALMHIILLLRPVMLLHSALPGSVGVAVPGPVV